jgi:hypothetical protein
LAASNEESALRIVIAASFGLAMSHAARLIPLGGLEQASKNSISGDGLSINRFANGLLA